MTDIEQEELAQNLARTRVQHAEDMLRDAIDTIPRVLFSSGVVFLSLVVPLIFNRSAAPSMSATVCFKYSVVSMMVSIVFSGLLFVRSIRVSSNIIDALSPVVERRKLWQHIEIDKRIFRWWEICFGAIAVLTFLASIVLLSVACLQSEGRII